MKTLFFLSLFSQNDSSLTFFVFLTYSNFAVLLLSSMMIFTFLQYVLFFEPSQVINCIPCMELYTNHLETIDETIFEGDFMNFNL
jgi:hypothetical protein